jgi:hypothetical protein
MIRLELALEFDKNTRVMTPAQSISKVLGEQVQEEIESLEDRAVIRHEKNKYAVRWDYDSCGILHEDVDNYQDCFKQIVSILEKINQAVPIGNLSSRIFRMYWILPADKYKFESLEQKYRQVFIKENDLFNNCLDSSAIVEMQYDGWVLHHQSGAMDIDQLQKDFKEFKIKKGSPNIFLFLSTTITSNDMVKYKKEDIDNFIRKSFDICKLHSDKFENMMEEIL